ncbi:MAG: hypothetical protein JWP16_875 [Alphaproteobacteria bacterium]|nr:hypothetical protein [Alphaproteobacteria bacterium]
MKRLVVLLGLLAVPAHAADDPMAAANAFYAVYAAQHVQGGGIPDATGRLRYSAVLTPRLNRQVADAAAAQARLSAKVRNAVPPMLEGDIFSSLFEGATAWQVGACTVAGQAARCPVALTHDVPPAAGRKPEKPAHWNDVLVLANTPAGWKVDDVSYDAGFAFGNTGKLSEMLAMVVAANP